MNNQFNNDNFDNYNGNPGPDYGNTYNNSNAYNNSSYNNDNAYNGYGSNVEGGYTNYNVGGDSTAYVQDVDYDERLAQCMTKSFGFMFIALLISAITAVYAAASGMFVTLFLSETGSTTLMVICIAELAAVVIANICISKQLTVPAIVMFVVYSITNGITLASIFYLYSMSSIVSIFFMTALLFGGMCVFGFVTKKDLSGVGSIGIMLLWGVIICSVVNLFLKSSGFDWIVSIVALGVFIGLTAWDTQKIKRMSNECLHLTTTTVGLFGALELYLDFINMFLRLLRLFGRSRN